VKLYEYLAAGKPVVSTPLAEVLPYRDIVNVATADALAQAVEVSLRDAGNREAAEGRRAVARSNTWDHRVNQVLEILRDADDRR
jgi:glycosyltransferase involved in cell wall biosynthesis